MAQMALSFKVDRARSYWRFAEPETFYAAAA